MKLPEVSPGSFRKISLSLSISACLGTNQEIVVGLAAGCPEDDEGDGPAVEAQLEVQGQHVAQLQTGGEENPRNYPVSLSKSINVKEYLHLIDRLILMVKL